MPAPPSKGMSAIEALVERDGGFRWGHGGRHGSTFRRSGIRGGRRGAYVDAVGVAGMARQFEDG